MLTPQQTMIVISALRFAAEYEEHPEYVDSDAAEARRIADALLTGDLIIVDDPSPVSLPQLMAALEQVPDPWSVR